MKTEHMETEDIKNRRQEKQNMKTEHEKQNT
jgi:hypothetical protein